MHQTSVSHESLCNLNSDITWEDTLIEKFSFRWCVWYGTHRQHFKKIPVHVIIFLQIEIDPQFIFSIIFIISSTTIIIIIFIFIFCRRLETVPAELVLGYLSKVLFSMTSSQVLTKPFWLRNAKSLRSNHWLMPCTV